MNRLALGLALIGVIIGVVAVVGLLGSPRDAGDPAVIEAALGSAAETSTTTTSIPPVTTTTVTPAPLWTANDASLLTEVSITVGPRPTRLIIDTLGIDAPVGEYGVAPNGQMEVPDNVTEVGWYKFGPSPGESGSAVLAAHVDLAGPGPGLFYDLDELDEGDEVVVIYDDGGQSVFRVVARTTYLKSELPLNAIFSRKGDPVLTLITCGGGFSESAGSYDSNVVVYAVPTDDLPG